MDDKNKPPSAARRAGRGLGRWLEKLLGRESAGRLAESAEVLRREFEAGRREGEDDPPRTIPHREPRRMPDRQTGRHDPG